VAFRIFLVCAVLLGACGESTGTSCCSGGTGGGGDGGSGGIGGAGGGVVSDLEVCTFISGLDKPWDVAWLPNGTVLVTERPGRLNVYVDGVDAQPFTISPSDVVSTGGEGGMMGLEVDPDFSANGYVYVCMASDAGEANDVRLVRYELETPNGGAMVNRTDIVTGMPTAAAEGTADAGLASVPTVTCGWARAMPLSEPRPRTTTRSVAKCCASIEMAMPCPAILTAVAGFPRGIATFRASHFALGTASGPRGVR